MIVQVIVQVIVKVKVKVIVLANVGPEERTNGNSKVPGDTG